MHHAVTYSRKNNIFRGTLNIVVKPIKIKNYTHRVSYKCCDGY